MPNTHYNCNCLCNYLSCNKAKKGGRPERNQIQVGKSLQEKEKAEQSQLKQNAKYSIPLYGRVGQDAKRNRPRYGY